MALSLTICIDIDGTICTNTEGAYEQAQPLYETIARVNRLSASGHRVILYTARGSTTGIDWTQLTTQQLEHWGVRYDQLVMGKPTADIYIDDKAINAYGWMSEPKPASFLEAEQTVSEEHE